jgi:hypothetical protein
MYKKITTAICLLFAAQSLHSQTISSIEALNKKLLYSCARFGPAVTSIYYLEYKIKGDSLIAVDASSVTNTLFKEKILEFYEDYTADISWKSILETDGSCMKTMRVIHPIFVLKDEGKNVWPPSEDILPEFLNLFSKEIFSAKEKKGSPVILMQPFIFFADLPAR